MFETCLTPKGHLSVFKQWLRKPFVPVILPYDKQAVRIACCILMEGSCLDNPAFMSSPPLNWKFGIESSTISDYKIQYD